MTQRLAKSMAEASAIGAVSRSIFAAPCLIFEIIIRFEERLYIRSRLISPINLPFCDKDVRQTMPIDDAVNKLTLPTNAPMIRSAAQARYRKINDLNP